MQSLVNSWPMHSIELQKVLLSYYLYDAFAQPKLHVLHMSKTHNNRLLVIHIGANLVGSDKLIKVDRCFLQRT